MDNIFYGIISSLIAATIFAFLVWKAKKYAGLLTAKISEFNSAIERLERIEDNLTSYVSSEHVTIKEIEGVIKKNIHGHTENINDSKFSTFITTLNFELMISDHNCQPIDNYDDFFNVVTDELFTSDTSYHVMAVTRESIVNYYMNTSDKRGIGWKQAQQKWVKENVEKGLLKRIVLVNYEDIKKGDQFKESVLEIIRDLTTYSEIMIYDTNKLNVTPKDCGIFFNSGEPISCVFTYVHLLKGQNFTKLTSSEYFTRNKIICNEFEGYFLRLWENKALNEDSEIFMKMHGLQQYIHA